MSSTSLNNIATGAAQAHSSIAARSEASRFTTGGTTSSSARQEGDPAARTLESLVALYTEEIALLEEIVGRTMNDLTWLQEGRPCENPRYRTISHDQIQRNASATMAAAKRRIEDYEQRLHENGFHGPPPSPSRFNPRRWIPVGNDRGAPGRDANTLESLLLGGRLCR
jgi:hypothetical protein